jgi:WD40 repeat protein
LFYAGTSSYPASSFQYPAVSRCPIPAAFSSDGKTIVSASGDGTARLWEAATGQELRRLQGHIVAVTFAAFSRDGKQIVTASLDSTARLWVANTKDLLTQAASLIQRDPPVFTEEERRQFRLDQ